MTQYCPHIKTCLFYQNWEEETKYEKISFNERKNVIVAKSEEGDLYYDCLPLIVLNASETNPEQQGTCSHITLLNFLAELSRKKLDK